MLTQTNGTVPKSLGCLTTPLCRHLGRFAINLCFTIFYLLLITEGSQNNKSVIDCFKNCISNEGVVLC